MKFKKSLKKATLALFSLFFLMFFARLAYSFIQYSETSESFISPNLLNNFNSSDARFRTNIATSQYQIKKAAAGGLGTPQMVNVDQKYEKTANISCQSSQFEKDEAAVLQTIKAQNAIIQYQQKSGKKGNRKLSMQIGVPPDAFDTFVAEIEANHKISSISITKTDKTNEYRELNSKQKTLQATRASLLELKNKGGKIEEFIDLENRILEIDNQLQALGVQLGDFDSENEFCTVNLNLIEGKVVKVSFWDKMKQSFEWTVQYYLMLVIGLFIAFASAFVLILILDKLKIIDRVRDLMD